MIQDNDQVLNMPFLRLD